jgi:RNA polymerase sigma-70 factor (ECF subfamily)
MNNIEFEEKIACHRDSLKKFISSKLKYDKDLTEDFVQMSLIKAFKYVNDNQQNIVSYKPWLYKIAVNLIIDHYKNKKYTISLENSNLEGNEIDIQDPFSYEAHIENLVNSDLINESLDALKENRPEIYTTFNNYLNYDNYNQIAKIENLHLGTVKTRIHRARKFIQKYLDNKVVFE